ncbi:hypothetical protein O987_07725 [Comamonas testosteroni TK102]|uniref:TonB-dependent receptor-like beta-barrel domain-containing protein n=1 Tax=Comamonas testosteroni TK102 TaxID=1392005 RepID=A0A076PJ93_COMTE|nr:hypothetical protein O987_07725 [Comamonas testosteroni TK102]
MKRADSYRDRQFPDRKAPAASVLIKPSSDTSVLLQADYLKDSRLTDFGIPAYQGRAVNVSPGTCYGAANARDVDVSRAEVASLGATLNHRISDSQSLRNALRFCDDPLDRNNTLVGSVNEKAPSASLTRSNGQRDGSGLFNQTEPTQKLELAGRKHQLLYGFEFGRQSKDLLSYSQVNVATVSRFNPVLPTLPLRINGKPSADNHSVFKVASLYLQDLVSINSQWKALAGVRYDRFQQETHERQPGRPDLGRTDTAWSPRVGLVYPPSSAWSCHASWGNSFQPSGETFALAANNVARVRVAARADGLDGWRPDAQDDAAKKGFNGCPKQPLNPIQSGKENVKSGDQGATATFGASFWRSRTMVSAVSSIMSSWPPTMPRRPSSSSSSRAGMPYLASARLANSRKLP